MSGARTNQSDKPSHGACRRSNEDIEQLYFSAVFLGWPTDKADVAPHLKPVVVAYVIADGSIIREVHQMNHDGSRLPENLHYTAGVTGVTRRNSYGSCPEISHDMVEPTEFFSQFDTEAQADCEIRRQILAADEIPRNPVILVEEAWLVVENIAESVIIENAPLSLFEEVMDEVFGSVPRQPDARGRGTCGGNGV